MELGITKSKWIRFIDFNHFFKNARMKYMKKILANAPLNQQLYHQYFNATKTVVTDVKIVSISSYLNQDNEDPLFLLWQIQTLLSKSDTSLFPNYQGMLQYPSFIQEIIHFAKDCIAFNLQKKDLPENDFLEKELKEIIGLVLSSSCLKTYRQTIQENKNLDFSSLEIQDLVLTNDYYNHLLKDYFHPKIEFQESISDLRMALNIRQEIEIMAQEICTFQGRVNIILSNYSSQFPLLKQLFQRYGIPFCAYSSKQNSLVGRIFKDLFLVSYEQNTEAFLDLIENNAFGDRLPQETQSVLSKYLSKVEVKAPLLPLLTMETLWPKEAELYQQHQENIDTFYHTIQESLSLLLQEGSLYEKIQRSYTVFRSLPFLKDPHERTLAISLESFLNQIGDEIDRERIPFFLELVSQFQSIQLPSQIGTIMVTDLRHPVLQADVSYIVGLNGHTYPNVPSKSGIFNESYYAQIPYPSYEERYHTYLSQLSWIFHSGKQIHFSYSQKDYEGKKLEVSYDIQKLFSQKAQTKKAKELLPRKSNRHEDNLSSSFMESWFTQNPILKGSVSSIEEWYRCPYQYFLNRLLKLKEQNVFEPNSLYIGTITHSLLEKALNEKKKLYYELSLQDLQSQLDPYFQLWKVLDPDRLEMISLIKDKLASNLCFCLQYLKEYEQNYDFLDPIASEQEFQIGLFDGLELVGKIDRLDQDQRNQDYYLYDYKSSLHKMDKSKYLSGQQIQLMTYKLVLEQSGDKKVRATYYFSLLPEKQHLPSLQYKFDRRSVEKDPQDFYETDYLRSIFLQNQSFRGWKLDEDVSDYNKNVTVGSKFKLLNNDFNEVTLRLLKHFYTQFKEGMIERNPQDCTFCPYRRICSYRGTESHPRIPDAVLELLEGEDTHD